MPATLSDNTFTDNGYDAVHAILTDNADSISLSNNHGLRQPGQRARHSGHRHRYGHLGLAGR